VTRGRWLVAGGYFPPMPTPFSLLPLAIAAGGGRVDEFESQQLVAAGFILLQRSAPLVRALSGRRAGILLPTSPQFLVALAACEGRGAVLVNPLAAPPEIEHQLADARVGAVFTVAALADRLPDSVTRVLLDDMPRSARVVADGVTREVDLGSHVGMTLEGEFGIGGSDEEAAIVYTSAMAGTPLGAVLSHRNLIANARATVEASANHAGDHVLALLPFSHLFGLTVAGSAPLMAGARVTTMARFDPIRAVELLESAGITEIVGVPAVFRALLSAVERRGGALRGALRLAICGGAALPESLQERWAGATGVELRQGYGLTEAGPVCLFNRVDRGNARGTLGVPLTGVEVRIAERTVEGRPMFLAAGAEGEIVVRGDNVFRGYLSGGEHGLRVQDGWLRTGDLGVCNADGTVTFRGIAKPMFTRSGFNVYPREIERVVLELPGVRAARVWPVPEPTRENDVALEVEASVGEATVKRWCEARLAVYKRPSRITVRA